MTTATAAAIDTRRHSIGTETASGPTGTATVGLIWDTSLERWIARFTQTESSRMDVAEDGDVTIHWNEADETAQLVLQMTEEWRFVGFLVGWDGETGIPVGESAEIRYSAYTDTPEGRRLVVDFEKPEGEPVFGYIFEAGRTAETAAFGVKASKERILIDPKITNKGDG